MVSLFLMLFAISMTSHPGVLTLLGLYSAAGSVGLMLTYWTGLRRYFADSDAAALAVQSSRAGLTLVGHSLDGRSRQSLRKPS